MGCITKLGSLVFYFGCGAFLLVFAVAMAATMIGRWIEWFFS
jgi:hypothetical protein